MFREGAVFNFRKNKKNFVSYALQFITRVRKFTIFQAVVMQ